MLGLWIVFATLGSAVLVLAAPVEAFSLDAATKGNVELDSSPVTVPFNAIPSYVRIALLTSRKDHGIGRRDVLGSFTQNGAAAEKVTKPQWSERRVDFDPEGETIHKRSPALTSGYTSSSDSNPGSSLSLGSDPYGYGKWPAVTTQEGRVIIKGAGQQLKKQQVAADQELKTAIEKQSPDNELFKKIPIARDKVKNMGKDLEHIGMTEKKTRQTMKKDFPPLHNPAVDFDRKWFLSTKGWSQKRAEKDAGRKARRKEKAARKIAEAAAKKQRVLRNSVKQVRKGTESALGNQAEFPEGKVGLGRSKSDPTFGNHARKISTSTQTGRDGKQGYTAEKGTQTEATGSEIRKRPAKTQSSRARKSQERRQGQKKDSSPAKKSWRI